MIILDMVLAIMLTIVVVVKTINYAKSENIKDIIPVEYDAPDDLNSAEVGYVFYKKSSTFDVLSLLPYLASEGYLKISNVDINQKRSETKDDTVYFLRKYDGDNDSEKIFMEYLEKIILPTTMDGAMGEVSMDKIKDDIMSVSPVINKKIVDKLRNKIFKSKINDYIWGLIILAITVFLSIFPVLTNALDGRKDLGGLIKLGGVAFNPFLSLFTIIMLFFCSLIAIFIVTELIFFDNSDVVSINGKTVKTSRFIRVLIGVVFGVSFGGIPIFFMIKDGADVMSNCLNIGLYIIGFSGGVIILSCIEKMRRIRTEYGNEVYRRILGFREYLEKVEKKRIKTLTKEDPKLCYKMMAYAYVLGVAKDWVEEFEVGINLLDS